MEYICFGVSEITGLKKILKITLRKLQLVGLQYNVRPIDRFNHDQ